MSEKRIQLFCIPFAGGSAASFTQLSGLMDESIDVHTVEYPGRGARSREPFYDKVGQLIADVKNQIISQRNETLPFALLGYSMGVEIAYDLAQYGLPEKPVHLFFSAREAIQYNTNGHDYSLLPTDEFIEKIVSLGGIDERIRKNRRFLEIYMRPVYADYRLLYQYAYKPENGKLDSDVTVFYCEKDTPYRKVKEWEKFTLGRTDFYELGDSHFFIHHHAAEMADIINSKLANWTNEI